MKKWIGSPLDLSNLRVFDCVAYTHSIEGKLVNRATKCAFLGYPHGIKGYRSWSLDDIRICLIQRIKP